MIFNHIHIQIIQVGMYSYIEEEEISRREQS